MPWETFCSLSVDEEAALFAAAKRINKDRARAAKRNR